MLSHGNYLSTLLATAARYLMEGGELSPVRPVTSFPGRHAPRPPPVPLVLMEPHHADAPTRSVFEDVKQRLHLPFINTDYRALARWPSYFECAWSDLKPEIGSPKHDAVCAIYQTRVVELIAGLPKIGGLTCTALQDAQSVIGRWICCKSPSCSNINMPP